MRLVVNLHRRASVDSDEPARYDLRRFMSEPKQTKRCFSTSYPWNALTRSFLISLVTSVSTKVFKRRK